MKIKRFLAPNMREALKAVRLEQGPDAVILSNRRVDEYIEIIAALDYDDALMQQALKRNELFAETRAEASDATGPEDGAVDEATLSDDRAAAHETSAGEASVEGVDQRPKADVHALIRRAAAQADHLPTHRIDQTQVTDIDLGAGTADLGAVHEELATLRGLVASQVATSRWQQRLTERPESAQVLRNLARLGLTSDVAEILSASLDGNDEALRQPWRAPVDMLCQHLPATEETLLEEGGVAAIVGPTGVGKTTTIAKLAGQYALRHGSRHVALVSMDAFRVGARDQLRLFARILNASLYEAHDQVSLRALLPELSEYKLVLIDTAGVSQRDVRLMQMLDGLSSQPVPVAIYLAMSATSDEYLLDEIVRCYQQVALRGAILTKVDEASRLGAPLSMCIRHQLPLAYVCDGQHVPDHLHGARERRLRLVQQALTYARESRFEPEEQLMAARFGLREVVNG